MKKYNITKQYLIEEYIINFKSSLQIANELNCDKGVILRNLKKYKIKIRSLKDYKGERSHMFIHGNTLEKNYCIDCGKKISHSAIRCAKCQGKLTSIKKRKEYENPKNHPSWKNGNRSNKHYCIVSGCNNKISYSNWLNGSKKCLPCSMKERRGQKRPEHSKRMMEKGNPAYIDGSSYLPYTVEFNKELKESIRKRDNYTCQLCGITEEEHLVIKGKVLAVHHIDYIKENCEGNNLITLCNQCNLRVNINREYWTEFFQSKIKEIS